MCHSTLKACPRLFGIALAAAVLAPVPALHAADFDYEDRSPPRGYYEPFGYPRAPVYAEPRALPPAVERRVYVDEAPCRVFYRPRVDAYGREVVHRVRVCDEGAVHRPSYRAARGPIGDYEPWGYDAPRPPRGVGPDFED
jgi:hypothetical protein